MPSKQCPAPNHPDEPGVWCGCKHPDFWRWGKVGWVPTEVFQSPELRDKKSRDMKARWARLKGLEDAA